jgi:hypothetical protein
MTDIDIKNERYTASMHRMGRFGVVFAILITLGMPTFLGLYFDALPSLGQIFHAVLPVLILHLPNNLFEVISYAPILGSSIYVTFITGELINIKIPVVNNAIKTANAEPGTVEMEIVSSIAVASASFVTITVAVTGVLLMAPLQGLLTMPGVKIASANVLPALFGALLIGMRKNIGGGIRVAGRFKGVLLAAALVALITFFDPQISAFLGLDRRLGQDGNGVIISYFRGFVMVAMLPVAWVCTKWLYKKGSIKVLLPGDNKAPFG